MPIQLDEYAVEKSTFAPVVAFTDENGVAVPSNNVSAVTWSLCNDSGDIINNLQDQSETPASSVTIVLSGNDLQLEDQNNDYELRHLEVSAIVTTSLGSDLPVKESAKFKVLNLKTIS